VACNPARRRFCHSGDARKRETTDDVNAARDMARHADIRTTQRDMHSSRNRLLSIAAEQAQAEAFSLHGGERGSPWCRVAPDT